MRSMIYGCCLIFMLTLLWVDSANAQRGRRGLGGEMNSEMGPGMGRGRGGNPDRPRLFQPPRGNALGDLGTGEGTGSQDEEEPPRGLAGMRQRIQETRLKRLEGKDEEERKKLEREWLEAESPAESVLMNRPLTGADGGGHRDSRTSSVLEAMSSQGPVPLNKSKNSYAVPSATTAAPSVLLQENVSPQDAKPLREMDSKEISNLFEE